MGVRCGGCGPSFSEARASEDQNKGDAATASQAIADRDSQLEVLRREYELAQTQLAELEERLTETREALRLGVHGRLWGAEA